MTRLSRRIRRFHAVSFAGRIQRTARLPQKPEDSPFVRPPRDRQPCPLSAAIGPPCSQPEPLPKSIADRRYCTTAVPAFFSTRHCHGGSGLGSNPKPALSCRACASAFNSCGSWLYLR